MQETVEQYKQQRILQMMAGHDINHLRQIEAILGDKKDIGMRGARRVKSV